MLMSPNLSEPPSVNSRSLAQPNTFCQSPTFTMVLPISQHLRLDTLQNPQSSHSPSVYSQNVGQLSDFATPVSELDAERPTYLSPARLYLAANARFAKPQSQDHHRRQASASENNSPASSSSPTTTVFSSHELRPWDRSSDLPSPLPSPISLFPGNGATLLDTDARHRSGSVGRDDSLGGTVSPALSSGSKTDAFFATSYKATLPTPPRPLHEKESGNSLGMSALGKGLPSSLHATPAGSPDRSTSSPQSRSNAFFSTATSSPTPPQPPSSSSFSISSPGWQQSHPQLRKSPLRSFTAPHPPPTESHISPRPQPVSRLVSGEQSVASGSTSSLASISSTSTPPPSLLRLPSTTSTSSKHQSMQHPPLGNAMRREATEAMVSGDNVPVLHEGDVIGEGSAATGRRWKLGHVLGEGAFSVVWSGRELVKRKGKETGDDDIEAGKLVAVKMMDKSMCRENDRTRISFVREVEVLRHISHPSVVPFLASFSTTTHHCLVLEHLGGGELFDLVSQPSNRARMLLPDSVNSDTEGYAFVRRIFGELCRAVGWLHEVGVVHRDIKLENLMLTANPFILPPTPSGAIPIDLLPNPLIKLTDFGLSRFISPASPMLVTRCGSESFAAPEIIMGKQYDGRDTDSWAVGVVLYALVAGELPFDEGAAGTSVSPSQRSSGYGSEKEERRRRMMRIAKGEYQWRDGIGSAGVRSTVSRLLVRDPKRRTRVGPVLWGEPWMHGPGEVGRPGEFNGLASDEVLGRRRVLDGFLVDEGRIDDVARAETA